MNTERTYVFFISECSILNMFSLSCSQSASFLATTSLRQPNFSQFMWGFSFLLISSFIFFFFSFPLLFTCDFCFWFSKTTAFIYLWFWFWSFCSVVPWLLSVYIYLWFWSLVFYSVFDYDLYKFLFTCIRICSSTMSFYC